MKKFSIFLMMIVLFQVTAITAHAEENYTWKNTNNKWYYTNDEGKNVIGWQKINNRWYYFDNMGVMQVGWQKISNKWYYLLSSGEMKTGWLDYSGKKYYLQPTGEMAVNIIVGEYKIDNNGVANKIVTSGWKNINNKWYYTNNEGKNVIGWQKINNRWYYFDNMGVMQVGWQKISNKWYYLLSSGEMKTGWLDYSGKKYYLQPTGEMASNTIIDNYIINEIGIAQHYNELSSYNETVRCFKSYKLQLSESKKFITLKDLNDDGINELILGIKYYNDRSIQVVGVYMIDNSGESKEIKSFYNQDIEGTARNHIQMFKNGFIFFENGIRYRTGYLKQIISNVLVSRMDNVDYDAAISNANDVFGLKQLEEIFVINTDWVAL